MTATTRLRYRRPALSLAVATIALGLPLGAVAQQAIIVQTNAAGDNIHLIDAGTNMIVGEISGIEVNHGATSAPDGSRFYITNEVDHTLDAVDARTLEITHKVALSGRPNNVAIRGDGRRVYVAIVSSPGAVDVIDTVSMERVKSISTRGGVHNTFMTPDSKYVVAGSIAGRNLTVIDAESEEAIWTLFFDAGVRPMSFETNPDGSTRRIFVQLSNFHGFAVVDFEQPQHAAVWRDALAVRRGSLALGVADRPGLADNCELDQGEPGLEPFHKPRRHSAADASRPAALLVGQIRPVFSLLAPGGTGASTPSVPRRGL